LEAGADAAPKGCAAARMRKSEKRIRNSEIKGLKSFN